MRFLFELDDGTEIFSMTCNDCKYFDKDARIENGFICNCYSYGDNCKKKNIYVSPLDIICDEYEMDGEVIVQ